MRTKTLLLAVAALAASLVSSQAQVYSANVVGYVNRTLPANPTGPANPVYAFVANPLDTGNNVLTNVLQGLPNGSKVIKWDTANSTFDLVFQRSTLNNPTGGWSPVGSGTNTVNPYEAFFIVLPNGNTTGFTNTFVGNVVQGSLTNNILPGYQTQGFQAPEAIGVTNSAVALNAALPATPSGTKFIQYDESLQGFVIQYNRTALGSGWGSAGGSYPSTPQITPGYGFFIYNAGTTNRPWAYNFTVQ